ncbi:hypothetical protein SZ64_09195 [Erythrobacter sp. SG61-1L]|uniref:hypothetical protein n=1 Tax=Erythrobacter sp. SG61-1L TaxID=1603897 RepID=UPI0006C92EE1|nr:hypothetical protein [Erythrobacter sp. SG61-1L]KPL68282.1 hypothetical protein SZ64_09195 [Erythrobacter sp. SG61-1L]
MIEDQIKKLVEEHYEGGEAGILLLSQIGMRLTKEGLWPPANDKRTLYEAAEATPDIAVVRDESAKSFIAVVKAGEEQRAVRAIADRQKRYFLRTLPRAFLLAFTLDIADGQVMSVRLGAKISYLAGPVAEEGTIVVDQDLRLPDLDVSDLGELPQADVEKLDTNIRAWCERHHVDPDSLSRVHSKPSSTAPKALSTTQSSALERLYAAQDPEVAKRLSVPIDIALVLSRMP